MTPKIIPMLLLLICTNLVVADPITTSCESTLNIAGDVTTGRVALSEICYTQLKKNSVSDYTFLKWSGYWGGIGNKYMQPVTTWADALNADLNATTGESGWRLPTIKELMLLVDYSVKFTDSDASDVFGKNWMIKQWLLRSSVGGSSLLPVGDAYILSSTYVGSGGVKKFMALHINTGEIEALDVTAANKIYVLKTKQEQPSWDIWQNKEHANCLSSTGVVGSDLQTENCADNAAQGIITNTSTNIKWHYESNSGLLRSYDNKCAAANTFSQHAKAKIQTCPVSTIGVNKYRWNKIYLATESILGVNYSFSNLESTRYHLYDNNNDAKIYRYSVTGVSVGSIDGYGDDDGDEDAVWIKK